MVSTHDLRCAAHLNVRLLFGSTGHLHPGNSHSSEVVESSPTIVSVLRPEREMTRRVGQRFLRIQPAIPRGKPMVRGIDRAH